MKNRTYEILEVAGPGDLFSRRINWAILVLVLFNTGVQCLDIWWPKTLMEYLQRFEWWPGKDILHYYFLYYSRTGSNGYLSVCSLLNIWRVCGPSMRLGERISPLDCVLDFVRYRSPISSLF